MADKPPILPLGSTPEPDSDFRVYSARPEVRFLTRAVQPPSAVYVDTSDVLQISCATSLALEVVTISYRILRADGAAVKGQFQVFPLADRAIVSKLEPLPEGFLLSVSCRASVATTRGQTFVRAFLTDPALGGGQPSYMLLADYVTNAMAPAHPNGRVLSPIEGPGQIHAVAIPSAPLGSDFQFTVPVNTRWRIISGSSQFIPSAVAGNRDIALFYTIFGANNFFSEAIAHVTASNPCIISWSDVTAVTPLNNRQQTIGIPSNLVILSNTFFNSSTFGLDAGDQFGAPSMLVEEWLDNV
jgi:hypothetical protein